MHENLGNPYLMVGVNRMADSICDPSMIRELLMQHGVSPTAEKIVRFSQDQNAMRKYGLVE